MAIFSVDTLSDDPSAGVTLREALALADGAAGADRIEFTAAIQGGTITLTGGQLTVASDVTIDGGSGITIDANQQSRVLAITGGSAADPNEVTLDSLTITGGKLAGSAPGSVDVGGGIYASGGTSLALTDSTVSGNSIIGSDQGLAWGGGIGSYGATVTLTNSTVSGNSITGYLGRGAGIASYAIGGRGAISLTDSTVSGNTADRSFGGYGGGISATTVTLTDSTVSGNDAGGGGTQGGGIHAVVAIVTGSTISGNDADKGGGIFASAMNVSDTVVSDNNADFGGGGIYSRGGATVTDTKVSGNVAGAGYGGGILAADGLTVTGSTISGNRAGGGVGGIFTGRDVSLTDSTISGNTGGIFSFLGTFDLTHCTVTANSGYGINNSLNLTPTTTIANSIVAGNGADVIGAAISSSNGHNIFGSAVAGSAAADLENVPTALLFAGGLADHGGPTLSYALRAAADNPALAAALAIAGLDTDQRGEARPAPDGSTPDIGAFELGTARLSLQATPVAQAEGNAGTTSFAFTVTRGGELASAVSATWTVTGGTVDGADFVGGTLPTGIVEFAQGQTEATITIRVQGDTAVEADESFTLTLSAPSFAAELGTATATGTIRSDDTAPLSEILGTGRADLLKGGAAAEILRGGGGGDLILALGGDDRLFGDGGDDVLVGGTGLDQMTGGRGEDLFAFRAAAEAPPAGPGYDEILDFTRQDEIDLRNLDANEGRRGNQAFDFLGTGALIGAAQLRYEATADGDFLVTGSTDADAAAEFAFIVRTDLTSLRAGDFML